MTRRQQFAFITPLKSRFLIEHDRRECLHCGYSLRGLPQESLQCPECGAPFDRTAVVTPAINLKNRISLFSIEPLLVFAALVFFPPFNTWLTVTIIAIALISLAARMYFGRLSANEVLLAIDSAGIRAAPFRPGAAGCAWSECDEISIVPARFEKAYAIIARYELRSRLWRLRAYARRRRPLLDLAVSGTPQDMEQIMAACAHRFIPAGGITPPGQREGWRMIRPSRSATMPA